MLEIWKLIAEAFKTLITSWPMALCVVAFIFRKSIAHLALEMAVLQRW